MDMVHATEMYLNTATEMYLNTATELLINRQQKGKCHETFTTKNIMPRLSGAH